MTEAKYTRAFDIGDYSDRFYSIQQKFVSVSLVSIFISIFNLDSSSRFFGVAVTNLNERLIEVGFFLLSFSLAGLYAIRLFEERNIYNRIDQEIDRIGKEVSGRALEIRQELGKLQDDYDMTRLSDNILTPSAAKLSVSFIKLLKEAKEITATALYGKPDEYFPDRNFIKVFEKQTDSLLKDIEKDFVVERNVVLQDLREKYSKLNQKMDSLYVSMDGLVEDNFTLKSQAELSSVHRFRIVLYNQLLPAVVFVILCLTFVFPNSASNFSIN